MSKPARKKGGAPKAPFSFKRHIVPPFIGILMMLVIFASLNAQWLVAQAQYYLARPAIANAQVMVSTTEKLDPNATPELSIPKLNVTAPVVFDEPSYADWKVQIALRRGVVHYGDTSMPGQRGNAVILGHSSGQPWAPGAYKFVFVMLNRLAVDDTFTVTYKGTRYVYKVTETKVVQPTDISVLEQTKDPTMTLITCTPVGTDKNRLVVKARQISPSPTKTQSVSQQTKPISVKQLPANEKTSLWGRIKQVF